MFFRNFYRCAQCSHEWIDEWSAQCDDDCPKCGARHMSPYKSEDMPTTLDAVREVAETFRRINGTAENLSAEDKLAMLMECQESIFAAKKAMEDDDA